MGPPEEFYEFVVNIKGSIIHIFNQEFSEIVLNELDTISDFCEYIKHKERLISEKRMIIMGGEKELLAFYLEQNRSFSQFNETEEILIQDGIWDDFISRPEYKDKKAHDKISYGWDGIINRAREGSAEYEKIARELARSNRFERRMLSKIFLDANIRAHEDTKADMLRRILTTDEVSYVFLFFSKKYSRDVRKNMLYNLCFFARGKFPQNTKVIGIATEKRLEPTCSYDFCVINKLEWIEDDQKRMLALQNDLELFQDAQIVQISEYEYHK